MPAAKRATTPGLVSLREAVRVTGQTYWTLYKAVQTGALTRRALSGSGRPDIYLSRKELAAWLKKGVPVGKPAKARRKP